MLIVADFLFTTQIRPSGAIARATGNLIADHGTQNLSKHVQTLR